MCKNQRKAFKTEALCFIVYSVLDFHSGDNHMIALYKKQWIAQIAIS